MKGVWKFSLGLSLGLVAGGAGAQEAPWHAASVPPAAPATLARPIPQPATAPAASLARPIPLAVVDGQVRPASFFGSDTAAAPAVVRGLSPDAKPMPVGPGPADNGTLKMPTPVPNSSAPAPAPPPGAVIPPPGAIIPPPDPVPGGDVILPGDGALLSGDEPGLVEADAVDGAPGCCAPGCGHRFYARAEYLMWWVKNSPAPPLITASPSTGPLAGSLADPNARIIYGGDGIFLQTRSGGRFTAGYWFDDAESFGLEGSAFFLGQGGAHFAAGASATPGSVGLFIPYTASAGLRPSAQEIGGAGPLRENGVVRVDSENRTWGAELDLRGNLLGGPDSGFRLGVLGGFRVFGMDESLDLQRNSTDLDLLPTRTSVVATDRFGTMNRFYAPQVGLTAQWRGGPWTLDVTGKLAMGVAHQDVDISGDTYLTAGALARTYSGGLFSAPTNIGHYDRNRFAVMPEVGANVGYQVTDNLRIYVGYTFMYLSNVLRPGDQIDPTVNPTQLANPLDPRAAAALRGLPRPLFQFHGTDYWVHGANVGLEFRY